MRYFTRAWTNGELSDDAAEIVLSEYRARLASLVLPPPLAALADVNIHDGKVLDVERDVDRLSLRLRVGDLQRGYSDLRLDYLGASLASGSLAALESVRDSPETEVLYTEVDRVGSQFEHRMLLWPKGEIAVTFERVQVVSVSVASRSAV